MLPSPQQLRRSARVALAACLASVLLAAPAAAHERYIVDEERDVGVAEFFSEALTDPGVVGPIAVGGTLALAAVAGYLRFDSPPRDVDAFRSVMDEYGAFAPWLLRIAFGIPLIGAGFGGYLISPSVGVELRILQVGLGFLLLFGLATRAAAVATLALYVAGAVAYPTMVLQLEFVGGMVAIALLGGGRPSADHTLKQVADARGTIYGRIDPVHRFADRFGRAVTPYERYVPTVVRVGLGITFVYLGLSQKLLRPGLALAVVDHYDLAAVAPISPELWVLGAGLAEVGLGIALIVGAFTRASAALAIAIFALTLFALPDDPVLAHVGLFGMASVLLITGSGPRAVDEWLSRRSRERASETTAE